MPETLLQTKLYVPPSRPNIVSRPHLIERLNQGLQHGHKLTLISAPAGFGKTTLVTEWIQQLKNVAWLSLDESDNDLARFFTYLIAALQKVDKSIGIDIRAALRAPQPPPVENLLTMLVNEITAISDDHATGSGHRFILVLEDYHLIKTQPIHEALAFLLDHLPPQMHLVITSRDDPFLHLSRLRVRDQMTEIRAKQLRFSFQETTAFLNQVMGLGLPDDDVAALETRTEGWIAGLHLAALSMQEHEDATTFISAFAGDDRYVGDYLIDEVLAQRPQGTREFLLQTSVLDRMTGPLCDAVTGQKGGQKMLQRLDQANLFIVPLDNRRRWYRYHHLFADLLRQRLEESTPSPDIEALHQHASQWYEENDFFVEAVEHALAAGDYQCVVRLIEQGAEEIFRGSRLNTLLRWWEELPPEIVESRPKLCLFYSWAWLATGHLEEAEGCLQAIETVMGAKMEALFAERENGERLAPAVRVVLVEIAVVRGQLAILRGDIGESLKLSRLALPYLSEIDQPYLHNSLTDLRSVVFFNMGMAYKLQGELSKADPALSEAMRLGQEGDNVHLVAAAFGHLANVQTMRGHLRQALRICHQGLQLIQEMSGRRSPMSGQLQAELGALLYERNDLKAAHHHLQDGISVARPWSHLDTLLLGYTGLARLRVAQGDWSVAFAALDELAELGQSNPEAVIPTVESFRARLWAAQGNVEAAGLWAETSGIHVDGELSYPREEESIVLARVLMAQKRWDAAARLIGRLLEVTESGERWGRVIELLILRALVLDAQDQSDEALESLARTLTLAEPQGYVRIFLDEGEPMAQLLYRAAAHGITPGYTGELLAAFQNLESAPIAESEVRAPKSGIIEPLSARELEVLDCLTEGLSNREIAQRLTISLTTVKTHTRNIYRKLDVHSRTQAVAKGKALGFVGS